MLKLVLIGILITCLLGFVLWNLWKMVLLKQKYYSKSIVLFRSIEHFEDSPAKLKRIRTDQIKTWVVGIVSSLFTVSIILTYFLVARSTFLNDHTHRYRDRVIIKPTCITEGVMEYQCRYCHEKYEEPISTVEHKYTESNRLDSTCVDTGTITYLCEMCGDMKSEPLALKAHDFAKTIKHNATCTAEGVQITQCKTCGHTQAEVIPINNVHSFAIASLTPASFWKNGYLHYSCKDCGAEVYSLHVNTFNWISVMAIVIFIASVLTVIIVCLKKRYRRHIFRTPLFWISLLLSLLSAAMMILHWCVIVPHQKANKPIFQNLSRAPIKCELVELDRTESTYTQNGTILYKCQKCGKEYSEKLPLKEIDPDQLPVYTEPELTECKETEKNGKFSKANEIPLHTRMTARLSSQKDLDVFMVNLPADGNLTFHFTHEADPYSNHWYATIYAADKSTVLNEGYIDKEEFGCSDLPSGTYYLKITVISGGNPIMNTYSDEKYHLVFIPECTCHAEVTQYLSETPACSKPIEIVTVCNDCGTIVSVEQLGEWEHNWGEWVITKPNSTWTSGKKTRVCESCYETQTRKISAKWCRFFCN